jgi:GT2 family glycosyltransferase
VGGFRSGVAEDKDFGQRAAVKGFRLVYDSRICVSHPARRDWPELRAKDPIFATEEGPGVGVIDRLTVACISRGRVRGYSLTVRTMVSALFACARLPI